MLRVLAEECLESGEQLVHVEVAFGIDVPGGVLLQAVLHHVGQLPRHDFGVDRIGDARRRIPGDQAQVANVLEVSGGVSRLGAAAQQRLDDPPHAVFLELVGELIKMGLPAHDELLLGVEDVADGNRMVAVAPGKTPFVAAVETNEQGHPLRMKLTVVEGLRLTEIAAWAHQHLGTGTRVVSDGLACFHGVTAAGCVHEPVVVGSGRAAVERPEFRWVNTILGNIKNALRGACHAIRPKYAQRYLSEFDYRFNRRFDLPDIIPRLVYVALRTPPMPERLLKLRLARLRQLSVNYVDFHFLPRPK